MMKRKGKKEYQKEGGRGGKGRKKEKHKEKGGNRGKRRKAAQSYEFDVSSVPNESVQLWEDGSSPKKEGVAIADVIFWLVADWGSPPTGKLYGPYGGWPPPHSLPFGQPFFFIPTTSQKDLPLFFCVFLCVCVCRLDCLWIFKPALSCF
jgi:hypothetical protein